MGGGSGTKSNPTMIVADGIKQDEDSPVKEDGLKGLVEDADFYYDNSIETRDRNILKQFLGADFNDINKILDLGDPRVTLFDREQRTVKAVDSVFSAIPPLQAPITVFRRLKGVEGFTKYIANKDDRISIGKIIKSGDSKLANEWVTSFLNMGSLNAKGYSTTTPSKNAIAKGVKAGNVVLRINVPKGAKAIPITSKLKMSSDLNGQILLNRDSYFRVRGGSIGKSVQGNYLILNVDLI